MNFSKHKGKKYGLQSSCKSCLVADYQANREVINAKQKVYYESNPTLVRFIAKKSGAKAAGIEFDLIFEDVIFPSHCPVLGVPIDYSFGNGTNPPYSPSFDRIDPRKGYITGNVIIISFRANMIKSNASVDELLLVANYYASIIPHEGHSHEAT